MSGRNRKLSCNSSLMCNASPLVHAHTRTHARTRHAHSQTLFLPPSRVVAASRCTEFWMAALVAASEDRLGRVFAMGRAAGVGGGAR